MLNYQAAKARLKDQAGNTKYFNNSFFKIYMDAAERMKKASPEEYYAAHYEKDGIIYNHFWDAVIDTDFYKKNGPAYCVFLEIAADRG